MDYDYSIKADAAELPAKALMAVKKLTGLSPVEIREGVAAGLPIYGCSAVDDAGLSLIARIHDELAELGVETSIFWYDRPEPYQKLLNTIRMHREIDAQEYD